MRRPQFVVQNYAATKATALADRIGHPFREHRLPPVGLASIVMRSTVLSGHELWGWRVVKSISKSGETQSGFTLVELMVTVALIAIVGAIAIPSFNNLIRSNRLVSAANEMVAVLQTARMGAINKRARVEVCPSANGSTCSAAIGNRWIALMTKNGVTTVMRDTTLHAAVTSKASPSLASASNKFVFSPSGFSTVGAATSGTLGLCLAELSGTNGVDVNASAGRITTVRRAASSSCSAPANN